MLRRSLGLCAALFASACAAPGATAPVEKTASKPASPTPETSLAPARWALTSRFGAVFDEAGPAPVLPGPEPALADGVRVILDGGLVRETARASERLRGFRSLPERLGGGFVLWSEARVYRAASFLGELSPIADIDAPGGVRPWLTSFLVRSGAGILEVDPASLAVRKSTVAGLRDAVAIDARRGVRLDALGRASLTVDGGATFVDLLAQRGTAFSALTPEAGDTLLLGASGSGAASLRLGLSGELTKAREPPGSPFAWMGEPRRAAPPLLVNPASRRALPDDVLGDATVAGALLPGGRLLVAREHGLRLLAAASALSLADADLLGVEDALARCQPIAWPGGPVLLACTPDAGGAVMSLAGAIGRPRLEITFPELGTFVAGPRRRLAFTGRCGPLPPTSADLGPGTPRKIESREDESESPTTPAEPAPQSPREPIAPDPEDARACVRVSADRWIERRLAGDDARRLYRWIPGDDGQMTALVLGDDEPPKDAKKPAEKPRSKGTTVGEGVRVIHLDPFDPALGGGVFPAVAPADRAPPYRAVDESFWQDDDGAIRGWLRLPAAGDSPPPPPAPTEQGPAKRGLRVEARRGGRSAGIRIDASGKITVYPLPEDVSEVVPGDRFGLAMAVKDTVASYFETTDGGRTWTPILAPPVGRIEPAPTDGVPFGCSAIGCTWGTGLVRLGWGGPAPAADTAPIPVFKAAANGLIKTPRSPRVECKLDTDVEPWSEATARPGLRLALKASPPRVALPKVAATKGARAPLPKGRSTKAAPPKSTLFEGPALPVSLRLGSPAALGALHEHSFSADVWMPFQPAAAVKHLGASDKSLSSVMGSVIPVLAASPGEPVDLLLAFDKRRLRAGAAGSALSAFDVAGKITVAADGPDGSLVGLDASAGVLWIVRGDAAAPAIRLVRLPDFSATRLTLGRRLDGKGMVIVGYSTVTGEVFAGAIDLGRAEIGPLTAIGSLGTLAEIGEGACSSIKEGSRFLADLPASLSLVSRSGKELFAAERTATFLLEGDGERLCAVGLEVGLPRGRATDLSVRFGRSGLGAIRTDAKWAKGSCALRPAK